MATEPARSFRTFLVIFFSQSLSLFGSAITYFITLVWVTQVLYGAPEQRTQQAFMLAAISLVYAIASIVSAPFAGAWADRYDRKRLIIGADLLGAAVSATLAIWMLNGLMNGPGLLLLMAVAAIGRTIHGAALDASYAMVVPEPLLGRANGMMQTAWSLSGVLGPGIASAILVAPALSGMAEQATNLRLTQGAALALGIDAVTFVVAAVALVKLTIPSPAPAQPADPAAAPGFWSEVFAGIRFVRSDRLLLWVLALTAAILFAFGPAGLLEPLIIQVRVADDWMRLGYSYETALAALVIAGNIGGVIGGMIISWWGGFKTRRVVGALLFALLLGVAVLGYGLSPFLYLTILAAALINGSMPLISAHLRTTLQTRTPVELQGRVFALYRVIVQATIPISTLVAGGLSGFIDPGLVIAGLGGLLIIFCLGLIAYPGLRTPGLVTSSPEPDPTTLSVEAA